jgi:N-acetylglucosaminyldiphosphoundecaprenol N-acetyl-beta-D-mannosaminyltransferase
MFGVGAAFDFHTGRIADCPEWVKRCGLQWLDRLLQDPRHLWKRCLRNNPAFLYAIALQLAGIEAYPARATIAARSESVTKGRHFADNTRSEHA